MSDTFDRFRDEVMKDMILDAVGVSGDRDVVRVALLTPTVVVHPPGADVVLSAEAWWMHPALPRPWKLPYNRLSKARRRQ